MENLKRAVIKEEYVAITGDMMEAIILNQFIYWSERVRDFDKFIQEERERKAKYSPNNKDVEEILPCHGWIYKKAIELKEEIMSTDSEKTINRYLTSLVEKGFLERRNNPNFKYDRTYQYRVNFCIVIDSLGSKGYLLQDYKFNIISEPLVLNNRQNDVCKSQNDVCKSQNDGAIPEITTDITLESTHTQETKNCKSVCVDVENVLGENINQKKIQELINTKGIEIVQEYIRNWDKYRHHANSTQASYFIYAVQNELPIPQVKKSTYTATKTIQFNFDEREYDAEQFYTNVNDE
jgi:hypothetical protein